MNAVLHVVEDQFGNLYLTVEPPDGRKLLVPIGKRTFDNLKLEGVPDYGTVSH